MVIRFKMIHFFKIVSHATLYSPIQPYLSHTNSKKNTFDKYK